MKLYEATVNAGGMLTKAQVQANDVISATRLLQSQYGKDNVRSGVYEVR